MIMDILRLWMFVNELFDHWAWMVECWLSWSNWLILHINCVLKFQGVCFDFEGNSTKTFQKLYAHV